MSKPKKGDKVSLAFSYAGLTSYESYDVLRTRGNKVWIDAHDGWFDAETGRYSADDFGASRRLLFDNGTKATEQNKRK
jgi:hypothetical protein